MNDRELYVASVKVIQELCDSIVGAHTLMTASVQEGADDKVARVLLQESVGRVIPRLIGLCNRIGLQDESIAASGAPVLAELRARGFLEE